MKLEEALQDLEENLDELAEAQAVRERQQEALELARARSILSGEIGGKNAEEREAQARTLLAEEYQKLQLVEERLIWARVRAEMARARFEAAKIEALKERSEP